MFYRKHKFDVSTADGIFCKKIAMDPYYVYDRLVIFFKRSKVKTTLPWLVVRLDVAQSRLRMYSVTLQLMLNKLEVFTVMLPETPEQRKGIRNSDDIGCFDQSDWDALAIWYDIA